MKDNLPNGQSYLCGQADEPLLYETIGGCLTASRRLTLTARPWWFGIRTFAGPLPNTRRRSMLWPPV